MLKFHLKRAHDRIVNMANKKRTTCSLKLVCGFMLSCNLIARQVSVRQGAQHKLSTKFYGPCQVIEKIGEVAYKLQLPSNSLIHPILGVMDNK